MQRSALACIYLVNLGTDKIHFRTSSDPRKLRRELGCEIPSKGECEYAEPERIEQKMQETLKSVVPSMPLFREAEFPLPPLPPPLVLTAGVAQAFASLGQTAVLSPLQKGFLALDMRGDLEVMARAFPLTIHERIAPGTDPNNPSRVCEAIHKQIQNIKGT